MKNSHDFLCARETDTLRERLVHVFDDFIERQ